MEPKTFIVTGAASGIGRECTRMLLKRDVRIAALDIKTDGLAAAFGRDNRVASIKLDLADPGSCHTAVEQGRKHLGTIDALLHFAAAWTGTRWEDSDAAEWARILSVNLTGTFLLTQAVARHM